MNAHNPECPHTHCCTCEILWLREANERLREALEGLVSANIWNGGDRMLKAKLALAGKKP